ncbi:MAG: hypothetical protein U1G08_21360, partial [Verrucomicrobiota bacterium]
MTLLPLEDFKTPFLGTRRRIARLNFLECLVAAITGLTASIAKAAVDGDRATASDALLQYDSIGRIVVTPTNAVPASLLPRGPGGMESQLPMPARGVRTAPEVHRRIESTAVDSGTFQWFPDHPPPLESYLAANDRFGNTALRPGPLIDVTPVDILIQRAKYDLYSIGLTYSLAQTLTVVHLSDVAEGSTTLSAYTLDLSAKWLIYTATSGTSAGWISTQVESLEGLGTASKNESPRSNL